MNMFRRGTKLAGGLGTEDTHRDPGVEQSPDGDLGRSPHP